MAGQVPGSRAALPGPGFAEPRAVGHGRPSLARQCSPGHGVVLTWEGSKATQDGPAFPSFLILKIRWELGRH